MHFDHSNLQRKLLCSDRPFAKLCSVKISHAFSVGAGAGAANDVTDSDLIVNMPQNTTGTRCANRHNTITGSSLADLVRLSGRGD